MSWSDTQIVATVPTTAATGPVKVTVGGVGSNANVYFIVPTPYVSSVSPSFGVIGTQVTVNGSGFGATQGSSGITFNGYTAAVTSWSDTQVVATVPAGATTGPVRVTVNSAGSNQDVYFTLPNPLVASLSPATGPVGTQVQINGSGFGATQGSSTMTLGSFTPAVSSWSDTQIVTTVPSGLTTGVARVTVGGVSSNANVYFSVPPPRVTGISPASGTVGTQVTVSGSGFQGTQGTNGVSFNGIGASVVSWSDTQIVATVPATTTGPVKVTVNGVGSNQDVYFALPDPIVTGLSPGVGPVGTQVQVSGVGLGSTQGTSTITFNGYAASVTTWSDTAIAATVPTAAITGPVRATVGGVLSNNNVYFTVPPPQITSLNPTAGGVGNWVTITGTGFRADPSSRGVSFNGYNASIGSWSDTQILAQVPTSAATGPVKVTVYGVDSNQVTFTVPSNVVSSVSPTSGPVGTQVTVTGSAFGASQGTSTLTFNGQAATSISSWSNTQIIGTVPVTATSGPVVVTVNSVASNATVNYTVPPPSITGVSPGGGAVGASVTITGSGFQATQRDSAISFNGVAASVTSWSDTQIVAAVPTGATTGPVTVAVNAIPSNSNYTFVVPNPAITSLTPPSGAPGGTITIAGSGFLATQPTGAQVSFNGLAAAVSTWSDTSVVAVVPANVTTGPVTVTLYGVTSNGVAFTADGQPTILAVTPAVGPIGSSVTITGSGFGASQSSSTIDFNGATATPTSWSDTEIVVPVPAAATTGPVTVTVAGLPAQSSFTINGTVNLTDSAGNQSSYTSLMVGGQWVVSQVSGPGCSSCTVRGVTQKTYDASGNVLTSTDALGRTTTYAYDSSKNVTSESVRLDANTTATTTYTYNSFGDVLTETDPLGHVTTNTYDAHGNLLTTTTPSPDGTAPGSTTSFGYNSKGQLTSITDALSHVTTLAYNPVGLIASVTNAQNHVTQFQYDARGNRTAETDALGNQTTYSYDLMHRLAQITYPTTPATTVTFTYDSRGRRTSVTDQNGKVTTYAYDDADRLTSVTDPATDVTSYTYDTESNLTSITDALGRATGFAYDGYGRVTVTCPHSPHTGSYDSFGLWVCG